MECFIAEYFREPDDFLGLLALNFSMGQWLSLPMIVAGVVLWMWAYQRRASIQANRHGA
jgi:phosphatidylglycerol---prolipoprotein diacylglyceryl transferase